MEHTEGRAEGSENLSLFLVWGLSAAWDCGRLLVAVEVGVGSVHCPKVSHFVSVVMTSPSSVER